MIFLTLSVFCHYKFGTRDHICENFAEQIFGTNVSWRHKQIPLKKFCWRKKLSWWEYTVAPTKTARHGFENLHSI